MMLVQRSELLHLWLVSNNYQNRDKKGKKTKGKKEKEPSSPSATDHENDFVPVTEVGT